MGHKKITIDDLLNTVEQFGDVDPEDSALLRKRSKQSSFIHCLAEGPLYGLNAKIKGKDSFYVGFEYIKDKVKVTKVSGASMLFYDASDGMLHNSIWKQVSDNIAKRYNVKKVQYANCYSQRILSSERIFLVHNSFVITSSLCYKVILLINFIGSAGI